MSEQIIPDALPFRVSPRTMQMLGRENVSNSIIAILELVKNAYDADASLIIVRFDKASTDKGSITIADNGVGMDLAGLRDHWMLISTDDKLRNPWTIGGRAKVGEKGIGRLGLDRLARNTTLLTHQQDATGLLLTIDWTRYETEQGELQKIDHPLEPVPKTRDGSPGTLLHMAGLRDRWTPRDYELLYSDLSLLVSPLEADRMEFEVVFDCDEATALSGPVVSPMGAVAEFRLSSRLTTQGEINHTLTHRSGKVFEDRLRWFEAFSGLKEDAVPACGPLDFELLFYLREAKSLGGTGINRAELHSFLDRFQGVRIYRDGFRVMPYGDPVRGGDWLGLNDRRVRSPGGVRGAIGEWKLAVNQVVGGIHITRAENPRLDDRTSREGLVLNSAFNDLRKFVLHCVQVLERQRQIHYQQVETKEEPVIEVGPVLTATQEELRDQAKRLRRGSDELRGSFAEAETPELPSDMLSLADSAERLADNLEVVSEKHQELETEHQLMLGLATLGIAMAAFGHETTQSINLVLARLELLRQSVDHLPEDIRATAEGDIDRLVGAAQRIQAWGKFALDRVSLDKRTQTDIPLNETIGTVLRAFEGILERRSIQMALAWADSLPPLRAFAMEIEAIMVNFITNAITALDPIPLDDRRILVATAYDEELSCFRIVFADSGHGIRAEDVDLIWSPLYSTKLDEDDNPIGTGLGLTILRDIVERYDGFVEVQGNGQLGGAEFHVILPHRYKRRPSDGDDR